MPEQKTVTGTVPPDADILSMIGEGLHTGLRKGTEAPSSGPLWQAISQSGDGAWSEALAYMLWGLRYAGWEVVKVTPSTEPEPREADKPHEFETERGEQNVHGPCAVCGYARNAPIHKG